MPLIRSLVALLGGVLSPGQVPPSPVEQPVVWDVTYEVCPMKRIEVAANADIVVSWDRLRRDLDGDPIAPPAYSEGAGVVFETYAMDADDVLRRCALDWNGFRPSDKIGRGQAEEMPSLEQTEFAATILAEDVARPGGATTVILKNRTQVLWAAYLVPSASSTTTHVECE
ncbi:MAG: hypothetical protein KTR31_23895 [Myxococcales bacterium]|nr:hypothetical protein [Myxococcales bacterium]